MHQPTGLLRKQLLSTVRMAPVALAGGLAVWTFPSHAEDAQVQDVVVSGSNAGADNPNQLTRQEERVLAKTPRSGGVVNGEKADEEHIERLSDFSQLVPNYAPNIGNPRTSKPAIRGIGAAAGTGDGSESDTGFVVDNVFWKHIGFQWADFIDVESFEVALGPQGTAGGKNTTVGNIVVKTQLPSFTPKAWFETTYANYSHVIEKLNVTGPLVENTLAYRVTFYLDKGDGWMNDAVTGAGLLNNNRWGTRGQLLYAGDQITDRLIFSYGQSHEYNNSSTGIFGNSFLLYANGTLSKTYAQTLEQRLHQPLLSIDPYQQLDTNTGTLDERQVTVSNEATYLIGPNTLQSISAFGEFRLLPRNSMGGEETAISDGHSNTWVNQFTQEVRFASPKEQKIEWTTGVFALYDHILSYSQTIYGPDAAQWNVSPSTSPTLMNGTNYNQNGVERTFNIAAYGQTTYHLDDDKTALTFGLRDGHEIKEGSDFGWIGDLNKGFTLQQVVSAFAGANGKASYFDTGGVSVSRNMLTGVFNPSYKFNDNILFYTLVGRGEKAGAVNTNALPIFNNVNTFQGFQPVITKAEYNWDYEIGAKTNWFDNRLVAGVNFYWTDVFNFLTNVADASFVNANGTPLSSTYLGTVPHVRLRGIEIAGRYTPFDGLWFSYNAAYTDARYIDYPDAPPPSDWQWSSIVPTPFGPITHPLTLSLSNTRFTGLPKWTFNVGANYERPVGKVFSQVGGFFKDQDFTAFGYANLAFYDRIQWTNPWSLIQYWQPDYTIVNAGVGLRTDDKRYAVELWVKNLFDTRYIQPNGTWTQGTATAPASFTLQAQPRYFGISFRTQL
jgi:iron complex outermembrane recepter protein